MNQFKIAFKRVLDFVLPWSIVSMFFLLAWQAAPYDKPFAVLNVASAIILAILIAWNIFRPNNESSINQNSFKRPGKVGTRPRGWLYRVPPTFNSPR